MLQHLPTPQRLRLFEASELYCITRSPSACVTFPLRLLFLEIPSLRVVCRDDAMPRWLCWCVRRMCVCVSLWAACDG